MLDARLSDRKLVLQRVIKPIENTIDVVVGVECETIEEVYGHFNESIKN